MNTIIRKNTSVGFVVCLFDVVCFFQCVLLLLVVFGGGFRDPQSRNQVRFFTLRGSVRVGGEVSLYAPSTSAYVSVVAKRSPTFIDFNPIHWFPGSSYSPQVTLCFSACSWNPGTQPLHFKTRMPCLSCKAQ